MYQHFGPKEKKALCQKELWVKSEGLSRGLRKVATEEILVEIGVRCQEVYIVELLQQRYIENLKVKVLSSIGSRSDSL